jgi:hypothetical protein
MGLPSSLSTKALSTGTYFLLDLDSVLELYKNAGFNIDNEDEEVPNVLGVDGVECFFTGDLVRRGEKYYEIVIAAEGFTWDEVESDIDEDDED